MPLNNTTAAQDRDFDYARNIDIGSLTIEEIYSGHQSTIENIIDICNDLDEQLTDALAEKSKLEREVNDLESEVENLKTRVELDDANCLEN